MLQVFDPNCFNCSLWRLTLVDWLACPVPKSWLALELNVFVSSLVL